MGHTLVGKAMPLQGPRFKPQSSQYAGLQVGSGTPWDNFCFHFFLLFFCFDFVPFVGDPQECRGDVAFPPTCGPALILSPLLGTPENAGVM